MIVKKYHKTKRNGTNLYLYYSTLGLKLKPEGKEIYYDKIIAPGTARLRLEEVAIFAAKEGELA